MRRRLSSVQGMGRALVREQDDEDAGDAEDGSGSAGAYAVEVLDGVAGDVEGKDVGGERKQVAGDAGEDVDGDEAEGADEGLAEQAEIPEGTTCWTRCGGSRCGRRWR